MDSCSNPLGNNIYYNNSMVAAVTATVLHYGAQCTYEILRRPCENRKTISFIETGTRFWDFSIFLLEFKINRRSAIWVWANNSDIVFRSEFSNIFISFVTGPNRSCTFAPVFVHRVLAVPGPVPRTGIKYAVRRGIRVIPHDGKGTSTVMRDLTTCTNDASSVLCNQQETLLCY